MTRSHCSAPNTGETMWKQFHSLSLFELRNFCANFICFSEASTRKANKTENATKTKDSKELWASCWIVAVASVFKVSDFGVHTAFCVFQFYVYEACFQDFASTVEQCERKGKMDTILAVFNRMRSSLQNFVDPLNGYPIIRRKWNVNQQIFLFLMIFDDYFGTIGLDCEAVCIDSVWLKSAMLVLFENWQWKGFPPDWYQIFERSRFSSPFNWLS